MTTSPSLHCSSVSGSEGMAGGQLVVELLTVGVPREAGSTGAAVGHWVPRRDWTVWYQPLLIVPVPRTHALLWAVEGAHVHWVLMIAVSSAHRGHHLLSDATALHLHIEVHQTTLGQAALMLRPYQC